MPTQFNSVVIKVPLKMIKILNSDGTKYRLVPTLTKTKNLTSRDKKKSIKFETNPDEDEIEIINNGVKTEIPLKTKKIKSVKKTIKKKSKPSKKLTNKQKTDRRKLLNRYIELDVQINKINNFLKHELPVDEREQLNKELPKLKDEYNKIVKLISNK
jgi:hypothetical protein